MAARTLLLKLQRRGLIDLPPPRYPGRGSRYSSLPGAQATASLLPRPPTVEAYLESLRPLTLEVCQNAAQRLRVRQWLQAYHYRGFSGPVGENLQYLVRDRAGRELAVMVFGAAAWKLAARDQFIGWSIPQRRAGLHRLANQQRFLILPGVRVPHLASHLLKLCAGRVSTDWQQRYGHGVELLESFVETDRFCGTLYRAAGWIPLGLTSGRTRQDRHHRLHQPLKSVWVRPLHPQFRQRLLHP